MRKPLPILIVLCAGLLRFSPGVLANDWPTYRGDAARSGYTSDRLPENLSLRWSFSCQARPRPAWPASNRVNFDLVQHPIVVGQTVVLGTSADDRVIALEADTGRVRWQFTAGGPVRFAPVAWRDRLFVASDDGWLYALSIDDGRVLWQFRGGPDDSLCLGNERLVSRWPIRGGPVVLDDIVYFTAGIWPTDGIFLHALRAATGEVLWTNDRAGDIEIGQPHGGATARSGVAPQGYLLADEERIYVPTGRAVPAVFRRSDGELLYYHLQQNHTIGGSRAMLVDRYFFNGGFLFEKESGNLAVRCGRGVVSTSAGGLVQSTGSDLLAFGWKDIERRDRKGQSIRFRGLERLAEVPFADDVPPESLQKALALPRLRDIYEARMRFQVEEPDSRPASINQHIAQTRPDIERTGAGTNPFLPTAAEKDVEVIVAGEEAVCGGDGWVRVVDVASRRVRWSGAVAGRALGLAVAGGRLLVSTDEGRLYCFDASGQSAAEVQDTPAKAASRADGPQVDYAKAAAEILERSGIESGICVDLGCQTGELSLELASRSSLVIFAVEDDPAKVAAARARLQAAGLYGTRVTVYQADPSDPPFPQHLANLIVSARGLTDGETRLAPETLLRLQRPFGGIACLGAAGNLTVNRRGPLEGAGSWTHQNADAANTLCSADTIAGPLSARWYRELDFELPDRHGQGPAPLFNQGYLVAEGVDGLIALDAYNGRTLWTHRIEGVLRDYDGVHHDVGVGDTGGTFCLSDGSVYARFSDRCRRLDLATGKTLGEFKTPLSAEDENRAWGYLAYSNGKLLGTVANEKHKVSPRYDDIQLSTESVLLFALDAATGEVLWQYRPEHSIRNNTISIADDRVYFVDRPIAPADRIDDPRPNGKHRPKLAPGEHPGGTLVALSAASGEPIWKTDEDIFGTQTGVSGELGILLLYYQAVRHNFFRLPSEVGGRMAAFDVKTGERLWDRAATHTTRPIINGDRIIAEGGAWDLRTGEPLPLEIVRSYGCGQFCGSRNLVLFRSATLGYHDLTRDAGTENFGGMRPGCWFNAVPAGGMVLIPDASAKCACSYQMHAWLALQGSESPAEPAAGE